MVNEWTVLSALSDVWDIAHEEESEWGMPMKDALRQFADKLGITNEYDSLIRSKLNYLWSD